MSTKRKIISIDEELCNGCGACVVGCHEGALQIVDGKAKIVSEIYCDGLGDCIGECPLGAISMEEREAAPYDEAAVMQRLAHKKAPQAVSGCPGCMERSFPEPPAASHPAAPLAAASPFTAAASSNEPLRSALRQWPVQLHLLNPQAGYFQGADVVLAADCTAYAYADFHRRFMRGHILAIACPKLDSNKEAYVQKLTEMIDSAQINTLTVVIMEVPCCGGLLQLAQRAAGQALRKVPIKCCVIGTEGEVVEEKWI